MLHRNAGVCETCVSLRARWTARLVAEYPSAMSRSQLNTLLDKYMDLNRCRQILEQRKASASAAGGLASMAGDAQQDMTAVNTAGLEGRGTVIEDGQSEGAGEHRPARAGSASSASPAHQPPAGGAMDDAGAGAGAGARGRDMAGMGMAVGKEFERIFGGLFRGKGAADAPAAGPAAGAQGPAGPGVGVQSRCMLRSMRVA